jgi:hypothetical protein
VIILSASEDDVVPVKKKTTIKPKTSQKSIAVSLEAKLHLNSKSKPHLANLKVPKAKIECASSAITSSSDNRDVNTLLEFT